MVLFTVGHSTYDLEYFLELIQHYDINCIVDVRSTPYSKYSSQFNLESIKTFLRSNNIVYIYMGKEFGARRSDMKLYAKEGYLDFEKVKEDDDFKLGIRRIEDGLEKGYNIAFMCTEKNPLDCHRCILVGKNFKDLGNKVLNIVNKDICISQDDIEIELLEKYYPKRNQIALLPEMNLASMTDKELIEEAYKLRNKEIGYTIEGE